MAQEKRKGTWVDEVNIVEEQNINTAISRLQTGDIDIYATTSSDADPFQTVIEDPKLHYYVTFGSYSALTFNKVLHLSDSSLNPFGIRLCREAMNYFFDRDYMAQELYECLSQPKTLMLNPAKVDYESVVETARDLENK